MMNQEIKTVIFDLGGVLIDWNPKYLYRKIFDTNAEIDHFLTNICTYDWNLEQDAGRSWAEATALLTAQFPEYHQQIMAYANRWEEMLGEAISEMVSLLEEIKECKQYRLYALTNWSAETFPIAQRKFEFLSWFEGIIVSGEEKTRKPAEDIYHILLDKFDITPNTALFIDDSLPNIETAERLGIHGIHFQSPEQAIKEFYQLTGKIN